MATKKKTSTKAGEGRKARVATDAEMVKLDQILDNPKGFPDAAYVEFRRARQYCGCKLYEEKSGEPHPGVDQFDDLDLGYIEPPAGSCWADFGTRWDIGDIDGDGRYEVVERTQSVKNQWAARVAKNATGVYL